MARCELSKRRTTMRTRFKLFGHSVHPMLIVFPLGLLGTSVIFDFVGRATGAADWPRAAYWMIAAGVISGLVAAVFGLMDWLAIPAGTRAKAIGLWHGLTNVVVVGLFTVSWVLRTN